MSLQLGLSFSEDDIEVQGEIDFDFFDDPGEVKDLNRNDTGESSKTNAASSNVLHAPVIRISRALDGTISKKVVETVIPTPESYKECYENAQASSNMNKDKPKSNRVASLINEKDFDEFSSGSSSLSTSDSEQLSSFSDEFSDKNDDTDSMTDISPLPSHCHSPMMMPGKSSSNVNPSTSISNNNTGRALSVERKGKSATYNGSALCRSSSCGRNKNSVDVDKLLKAMEELEIKQKRKSYDQKSSITFQSQNARHRKNMTFTNEEVRKIDRENQRLLKRIISHQNRTKPHFAPVYSRPASSHINRQKLQRQIELDNLALLKRLESAKPSQDLCRDKLLNEYKQRSGVPSRASTRPTSRLSSNIGHTSRNSNSAPARSGNSSSHLSSRLPRNSQVSRPATTCGSSKSLK